MERRSHEISPRHSSIYLVGLLLVLVFGFTPQAFSQVEATIVGTVTDPSGSVIPNVTITVIQTATGETRSTTTNGAGQYTLPDLHIGPYSVKAEAAGFALAQRNGVVLNVG